MTRRSVRAAVVAVALATLTVGLSVSPAAADLPHRDSVRAAGAAADFGSTGNILLNRPVVDIAATTTAAGYWLLAGDGGVFSFGNAAFYGSTGGMQLNRPALRMAPTTAGRGYWFVASDGGVFAFGDASFFGSMGGRYLARPMIGIIPTSSGRGYWMVAEDGGVFAFGDAGFLGSLGGRPISAPIVALAATRTNNGYWLLGRDGAVYAFGDAAYLGRDEFVTGLATDIATLADGTGYVTLDETGAVWTHRSAGGPVAGTGRQPARRCAGGRARVGRERRGIVGRVVGSRAVARLGLRPGIVPPARRRALEPVPRHRLEVRSAQRAAERARVLRGAVRLRRAA